MLFSPVKLNGNVCTELHAFKSRKIEYQTLKLVHVHKNTHKTRPEKK